ncbi:MAG: hypothetical protein ACLR4W_03940 [Oscillospiraceae bacterium]
MDNVQPMDGLDFLSLAVTAVVSYLVLFLLTKLVGNKQISQMTMFDYISGISVGSIAAEMATEPESPMRPLTGMVVYGLLAWGVTLWTNKSRRAAGLYGQAAHPLRRRNALPRAPQAREARPE